MKIELRLRLLISLLYVLISSNLFGQNPIPNAGLESWSGNVPDGWSAPANIPQAGIEPLVKSPEAYSDSWAARGIVIDVFGTPAPPVLYTGSISQPIFPVAANHSLFTCFYKYDGVDGDALLIEIVFLNLNVSGGGSANIEITADNPSVYSRLDAQINYDPGNPTGWQATHASITITIKPPVGQVPHVGTWFLVDHFMFDNLPITGIHQSETDVVPEQFSLEQNYPNPFNPSTNINFSLPEASFVSLKVYNLQGEEVSTLINEQLSAGVYTADWNTSGLSSGAYFYVIRTGNIIQSRKMLLIK
jgi:hypothetical protein